MSLVTYNILGLLTVTLYYQMTPVLQCHDCTCTCDVWTGTQVLLSATKPWCVLVVTDVMRRAQTLYTADELVFIDSSCSCDVTQSTVTMVLVASKAGPFPLQCCCTKASRRSRTRRHLLCCNNIVLTASTVVRFVINALGAYLLTIVLVQTD